MGRLRADLNKSWGDYPKLLEDIRSKLKDKDADEWRNLIYGENVSKNITKYAKESANWEYEGEKSITTLEEALQFCKVDLEKYEPKSWRFGSNDVSKKMKQAINQRTGKSFIGDETSFEDGDKIIYVDKSIKRVNYTVRVEFQPIKKLNLTPPVKREILVNPTSELDMWVVIGCVHRPFHNKTLWDNFLSYLEFNKGRIKGIIINGDYLDLRSLSSHNTHMPKGIDLSFEYSDGKQGIHEIESILKKSTRKIFHYGNHENRYLREMESNSKYGSALISPEKALGIEDTWEVMTDYKDGYTLLGNNLEVFHGNLFGINAAKSTLEQMPERSCLFNHTHRIQSFSSNMQTAWNIGWMGDKQNNEFNFMERRSRRRWQNGFAEVFIDGSGKHYVNQMECENSKIFNNGKLFG